METLIGKPNVERQAHEDCVRLQKTFGTTDYGLVPEIELEIERIDEGLSQTRSQNDIDNALDYRIRLMNAKVIANEKFRKAGRS